MNIPNHVQHIKQDWAASLKKARIVRGLTHQQLAAETGVSKDTISRLENGKSVSLDALLCIAVTLGHGPDLLTIMKSPRVTTIAQHQALDKGRFDGRSRVRAR